MNSPRPSSRLTGITLCFPVAAEQAQTPLFTGSLCWTTHTCSAQRKHHQPSGIDWEMSKNVLIKLSHLCFYFKSWAAKLTDLSVWGSSCPVWGAQTLIFGYFMANSHWVMFKSIFSSFFALKSDICTRCVFMLCTESTERCGSVFISAFYRSCLHGDNSCKSFIHCQMEFEYESKSD